MYIKWNITQQQKKNEILPFATIQMNQDSIMQSEISQT